MVSLRKMLVKIATPQEIKHYQSLFHETFAFAVIYGQPQHKDQLAGALEYLCQMDLFPVVVYEEASVNSDTPPWNLENIIDALAKKTVPEVFTHNGLNQAMQIASDLSSKKLIILNDYGGIKGTDGEVMPYVNLGNGLDEVHADMKQQAQVIKTYLQDRARAVTITSPENLLREIFTFKGSGTYFKNHQVGKLENQQVHLERIKTLIEQAFGRQLIEGYFSKLKDATYYAEAKYRGAAIVRKPGFSFAPNAAYMDKLVVQPDQQDTGLGRSIFDEVARHHEQLIWRAKKGNPANTFYLQISEGHHATEHWSIYWKGFNYEVIPEIVAHTIAIPKTLKD